MEARVTRRSSRLSRRNNQVENIEQNSEDAMSEDDIDQIISDDNEQDSDYQPEIISLDDEGGSAFYQPEVVLIEDDSNVGREVVLPVEQVVTDATMKSPESNMRISAVASQTTPGLAKNGPPDLQAAAKEPLNDSMDEEQSCPICFEIWTNTGAHRLASLPCGHLFGRSCIERWLKEPRNKFCPQCKSNAKRKDIRNIFAKSLKALDTSEKERVQKALLEEKYKRNKAEENEAKAVLQYQLLKAEMDQLRKEMQDQQTRATTSSTMSSKSRSEAARSKPLAQSTFTGASSSSHQNNAPITRSRNLAAANHVPLSSLGKTYQSQRVIQVAQKDARVLSYDTVHMVLTVTKPSPNQLFKGHGVLKVSSLETRSSEYISIHQNTIRDAKFNRSGDQLLLTASTDKTLKLTSVLSNSCVQTYNCPNPVWACAWNERSTNYVYAGLQNGSCHVYDIRQTNSELTICRPRIGVARPIVSLAYVPPGDENSVLRCEGVLVGTLQGGWFIQNSNDSFLDHQLILPEGSCSGLYFDQKSRFCLLSQRPGKKSPRIVHNIFQLVGDCSANNPIHANIVQRCFGGNKSQSLTRSALFPCPGMTSQLMVASGDEASLSAVLWDGGNGQEFQKLPCQGGTIFDVLSFQAYETNFIAALSEQKLSFYQWM